MSCTKSGNSCEVLLMVGSVSLFNVPVLLLQSFKLFERHVQNIYYEGNDREDYKYGGALLKHACRGRVVVKGKGGDGKDPRDDQF